MDQTLLAHVKLDIASDAVRIDVRGSLTQDTRPALMRTIQRVRRMGITSHITISLKLRWSFPRFPSGIRGKDHFCINICSH
ncbi:hypothetical protein RCH07_000406 [Arthrobacter sp. CG_A4]|nr:hypothetical protein [Arthrobacter sp. CG_A4]